MTNTRPLLDEETLKDLVNGQTVEKRALAAEKLCQRLAILSLADDEIDFAKKIISLLARDKAELVRQTLSCILHSSTLLEPDIIEILIQDTEAVAEPILRFTPNIDDELLLEIILNGTSAKKHAICQRAALKPDQVEAFAEYGELREVCYLAANPDTIWTDIALDLAVKRFASEPPLQITLGLREGLSPGQAERLVKFADRETAELLASRHALPPTLAISCAEEKSGSSPQLDLAEQAAMALAPARFAQACHESGLLNGRLITRTLCLGGIVFVEHALAMLADVPCWKTRPILRQAGARGIKTLLMRAGLSPAIASSYDAIIQQIMVIMLQYEDQQARKARLIERILTDSIKLERVDRLYLLDRLETYSRHNRLRIGKLHPSLGDSRMHSTRRNTPPRKPSNNQQSQTGFIM